MHPAKIRGPGLFRVAPGARSNCRGRVAEPPAVVGFLALRSCLVRLPYGTTRWPHSNRVEPRSRACALARDWFARVNNPARQICDTRSPPAGSPAEWQCHQQNNRRNPTAPRLRRGRPPVERDSKLSKTTPERGLCWERHLCPVPWSSIAATRTWARAMPFSARG